MTEFFSKRGLAHTLSKTELFTFIVDKEFHDAEFRPTSQPTNVDPAAAVTITTGSCSLAAVVDDRIMREYLDFMMAKISVRKLLPSVMDLAVGSSEESKGLHHTDRGSYGTGRNMYVYT